MRLGSGLRAAARPCSARSVSAIGLAVIAFAVSGCDRAPERAGATPSGPPGVADPSSVSVHHLSGTALGTTWNVRVVSEAADFDRSSTTRTIEETLRALDQIYSTWRSDSELSELNVHPAAERIEVSDPLGEVLQIALDLAAATEGAFDPTVLPVLLIQPPRVSTAPTAEALSSARSRVDFRKIESLGEDSVRKLSSETAIELSAVAKGYCVDAVSYVLFASGFESHLVEIGGEVLCRGQKPGEQPWRIAIEAPPPTGSERNQNAAMGDSGVQRIVELRDRAQATSGHYRQFVQSGGASRSHIVDARSGETPVDGPISVSVSAPTCAVADGLATALMVVPESGVEAVLERFGRGGVEVLAIYRDGDGAKVRERDFRFD
ncbi:MAG: FAD:protein FMN transferase [Planctomycetota bacterium]